MTAPQSKDASVPVEPTWVKNLRKAMQRGFARGVRVTVDPYDLADAIDHYEQWKAEAGALRAENAALREALEAADRLHFVRTANDPEMNESAAWAHYMGLRRAALTAPSEVQP